MLDIKQIDDNTIQYNGKLFKHMGEDVVSPLVQNATDNAPQSDVLFVSEDGVTIRQGDNIWCTHKDSTMPVFWYKVPKDWKQCCERWGYINFKAFSTEQAAKAYIDSQKPKLPTLEDVFKKLNPKFFLDNPNNIGELVGNIFVGDNSCLNHLSVRKQWQQLQAYIALRNIADYYNEETQYTPCEGHTVYTIEATCRGSFIVEEYEVGASGYSYSPLTVAFKYSDHAEQAIEILREANLLDALKG